MAQHLLSPTWYYISMDLVELVFESEIENTKVGDMARLFTESTERQCVIQFISDDRKTIRIPVWKDIDDTHEKMVLYETN